MTWSGFNEKEEGKASFSMIPPIPFLMMFILNFWHYRHHENTTLNGNTLAGSTSFSLE
jgi:hypothetical protein